MNTKKIIMPPDIMTIPRNILALLAKISLMIYHNLVILVKVILVILVILVINTAMLDKNGIDSHTTDRTSERKAWESCNGRVMTRPPD